MGALWQDVRYGFRILGKQPGFAAVAILTLALGIGANTAIFSLLHSVLLRPLPFQDPDRLAMIFERNFPRDVERNVINPGNFMRWQQQAESFERMAAYSVWEMNLTGEGEPERAAVGLATAGFFDVLGVAARQGRVFSPEEYEPGSRGVALLSYGYWQARFAGDASIIGKTLTVSGTPSEVVGILPPDFEVAPTGFEAMLQPAVWVPMALTESHYNSRGRWKLAVGRLKPGVALAAAQAEMDAIAERVRGERPELNEGWGINLVPLDEQVVGSVRPTILVLAGGVGLVLLIACANLANLLLARGASRQREIAVRAALGASRGQLVRQMLVESLLLAIAGGALGLLLAAWGIEVLPWLAGKDFPRLVGVGMNPAVLLFTLAATLVTGFLFGIAPALTASRANLAAALKEGARGASSGVGRGRLRSLLVVSEVALALVLLVGAGLLLRSFDRLLNVPIGFEPEGVLSLQFSLPSRSYDTNAKRVQFFEQALDRIAALPEVESAGAISWLPLSGPGSSTTFRAEDAPEPAPGEEPAAEVRTVSGELFRAMRIPLLRGRGFTPADHADAPAVVIISQSLVEKFWPGQDPLGRYILMNWGRVMRAQVVGVVGDVRLHSLELQPRLTLYWHLPQLPGGSMSLLIRSGAEPAAVAPAVRSVVRQMDAELPLTRIRTMGEVISGSVEQRRAVLVLLGTFAGLALLLALVGLYGVIAFSVTQRVQEIGIRMALGAAPRDILWLIVGGGMRLVAAGLLVGLAAGLAATRYLESLLFEVQPTDPLAFAAVSALLALVGALACAIPARRAARTDPLAALRHE